jgi:hypothetical protein
VNGIGLGGEMVSLCGLMLEDNERVCSSGAERWMMKYCVMVTEANRRGLTDYYPLLEYYALYFLKPSKGCYSQLPCDEPGLCCTR